METSSGSVCLITPRLLLFTGQQHSKFQTATRKVTCDHFCASSTVTKICWQLCATWTSLGLWPFVVVTKWPTIALCIKGGKLRKLCPSHPDLTDLSRIFQTNTFASFLVACANAARHVTLCCSSCVFKTTELTSKLYTCKKENHTQCNTAKRAFIKFFLVLPVAKVKQFEVMGKKHSFFDIKSTNAVGMLVADPWGDSFSIGRSPRQCRARILMLHLVVSNATFE